MRVYLFHILASFASLLLLVGCDVHEFPQESEGSVELLLHLEFDTEMPLYKTISYTRKDDSESSVTTSYEHDVRYIIKAYRTDNVVGENRIADTTFIFTRPKSAVLDNDFTIELKEGRYDIRVWTDYVSRGSDKDKYYNTSDFAEVILINRHNHSGNNDHRDAFKGEITVDTRSTTTQSGYDTGATIEATIAMSRPMGKYMFVATDGEAFVSRVAQMLYEQEKISPNGGRSYEQILQSIDLSQFKVILRYDNFMPCSFNMFTNKCADAWTGVSFPSRMAVAEEISELSLGYDYIFVGNNETTLNISIDVYDKHGVLLCTSKPINVPIARSKLTIVKGSLLSSSTSSGNGAAIDPGYDGDDYNIEI